MNPNDQPRRIDAIADLFTELPLEQAEQVGMSNLQI